MIRLPSLSKPYHAFVTFDEAIIQPPDASDTAACEDYAAKIRSARQTGDWSSIVVPGQTPTKFILRPMPFDGYAVILGMIERKEPQEDVLLLAARLCLTGADGVGVKVDFDRHERFGKVAALSTFERFGYSQGLRIAVELGAMAIQRASEDDTFA